MSTTSLNQMKSIEHVSTHENVESSLAGNEFKTISHLRQTANQSSNLINQQQLKDNRIGQKTRPVTAVNQGRRGLQSKIGRNLSTIRPASSINIKSFATKDETLFKKTVAQS